jgi:hypothetical protein
VSWLAFWSAVRSALWLSLLLLSGPALAADHALLIGVSDYPNLPRRLWLRAPGNDVALMRELLVERGVAPEHIRQLVSRAGGEREPTRRNILDAMAAVQAQVQRGDRVLLYLAGHGSQQPQPAEHGQRPTEPDGLDEVFLPADVQRWDGTGSAAAIPNALLDDEIGEWIDAVVDRGATVWAVFDTCHAAGMARAPAGAASRMRAVAPAELGLPAPRRQALPLKLRPAAASGRTDGRVLALAARAHEATGEEWLPQGAPMGSNHLHGVFTFHVVQALRAMPQATMPMLERAVRAAYARERRIAPTPEFKGDTAIPLR